MLLGCTSSPTEILVEVHSDLFVPEELDRIEVSARSPEGRTQSATATLGGGQLPLPRVLGLVHTSGALGPYTVSVRGERAGRLVVERAAEVTFQPARTLVLRVDLLRECMEVSCTSGQTCASGGCRSIAQASTLSTWDGRPPPLDAAAVDACVPTERCNGVDDDCDGMIDEGFDLQADPMNCGACRNACATEHTRSSCTAGRCVIDSCDAPFADCDGDAGNGCETDTTSAPLHCGGCAMPCAAPNRDCCSGVCGRC